MKCDLQMAEPRSATLLRHTRQAIRERRLVVTSFAAEVADRYFASHEVHLRVVKLREPVGDVEAMHEAMKHNAQIVDRYIKGVLRAFPVDLEEAWTDALPEPYRLACQRELARRMGFLGAMVKQAGDCAHASMADVLHEFGEFVAISRLALATEELTHQARLRFVQELDDVVAALTSMRQQATAGVPGEVRELRPGQQHA